MFLFSVFIDPRKFSSDNNFRKKDNFHECFSHFLIMSLANPRMLPPAPRCASLTTLPTTTPALSRTAALPARMMRSGRDLLSYQCFQFSSNSRKFLEFRLTTHSMRIFLEFVPSRKFDSEEFLGSFHKSHITLQNSSNNKNVFSSFNDTDILRYAPFDMLFSKFSGD